MRFTKENTIGFSRQELDLLNALYEERILWFGDIENPEELKKLQDQAASIILEEFTI
jgi:hypothetical protein